MSDTAGAARTGAGAQRAPGDVVEARRLTKRFAGQERPAVDEIDLTTEQGEYSVSYGDAPARSAACPDWSAGPVRAEIERPVKDTRQPGRAALRRV